MSSSSSEANGSGKSKAGTIVLIVFCCLFGFLLFFICQICGCCCKKIKQFRARRLANRQNDDIEQANEMEIQQIDRIAENLNNFAAASTSAGGLTKNQIDRLPRLMFNPTANPNSNYQTDKMCMVCLSDYTKKDKLINLPCKHSFHDKCAVPWLQSNTRCPLCSRSPLEPAEPPEAHVAIKVGHTT